MASERKVRFLVSGEMPKDKVEELAAVMAKLGISAHFSDLDVISPSVLIEYLEGESSLPIPAVTTRGILDFLVSEGEPGSKASVNQFMWTIEQHTVHEHDFGGGYNYYNRLCRGCDCPLRIVNELKGSRLNKWVGIGGIDPQSIINFSKLPFEEAREIVEGLGKKRYEMVQRIAQRLQEDLDIID